MQGSLEKSIGMSFGVFLQFSFYPYNYYSELYMFDKPIVVKLICYCVEREPYKSSIFLINMNWWNKVRKNLERDIDFVFSFFPSHSCMSNWIGFCVVPSDVEEFYQQCDPGNVSFRRKKKIVFLLFVLVYVYAVCVCFFFSPVWILNWTDFWRSAEWKLYFVCFEFEFSWVLRPWDFRT